jgi:hypothetical protein
MTKQIQLVGTPSLVPRESLAVERDELATATAGLSR